MDEIVAVMKSIEQYVRFPCNPDSMLSEGILQDMVALYKRASLMEKGAAKSLELIRLFNLYKEYLKESRTDYKNETFVVKAQMDMVTKENNAVKNENIKLKQKLKEVGQSVGTDKNAESAKQALDRFNEEAAKIALQNKKRKVRTKPEDLFR
ncbi:hypothetical protein CRE_17396 [Caenorhabditis remanei]|uniref:Uncharacterized protein n=1 Tax=Caenorhabditis remanei TaxID=31234 RepID=E3N255_CAERE|nr:hypothetical protein CRE_17396 [Caenorhabditis remanei]